MHDLSWSPDPKPFIVMCLWVEGLGMAGWRMLDIPLWTTRSSSWSLHFENEVTAVNEHLQYQYGSLSNMQRFIPKKIGFRDGGMGQYLLEFIRESGCQGFTTTPSCAPSHQSLKKDYSATLREGCSRSCRVVSTCSLGLAKPLCIYILYIYMSRHETEPFTFRRNGLQLKGFPDLCLFS